MSLLSPDQCINTFGITERALQGRLGEFLLNRLTSVVDISSDQIPDTATLAERAEQIGGLVFYTLDRKGGGFWSSNNLDLKILESPEYHSLRKEIRGNNFLLADSKMFFYDEDFPRWHVVEVVRKILPGSEIHAYGSVTVVRPIEKVDLDSSKNDHPVFTYGEPTIELVASPSLILGPVRYFYDMPPAIELDLEYAQTVMANDVARWARVAVYAEPLLND